MVYIKICLCKHKLRIIDVAPGGFRAAHCITDKIPKSVSKVYSPPVFHYSLLQRQWNSLVLTSGTTLNTHKRGRGRKRRRRRRTDSLALTCTEPGSGPGRNCVGPRAAVWWLDWNRRGPPVRRAPAETQRETHWETYTEKSLLAARCTNKAKSRQRKCTKAGDERSSSVLNVF